MTNNQNLTQFRQLLVKQFSTEELRVLCFDLGVDYEDLAGRTKTTKMQALILYMQRRNRLPRLRAAAAALRPETAWPEIESKPAPVPAQTAPANIKGDYTDEKTGLEMIYIPAGEFIYGKDNRLDYLTDYWIAKTPVTNRHYLRFVRAENYEPPKHWQGSSPSAEIADHPVVYVSWHDATAYAEWAEMTLPTEQEWEKAARGTDGRVYPWGNSWRENHCNTRELWGGDLKQGKPTPVGQFSPHGDSPYGCVDMAGNVWEWTASWFDTKKRFRVVRGGSWDFNHYNARAADRGHDHPAARDDCFGFRVVRRPPSQDP